MNKKERRQDQLERHYTTLEKLAEHCGVNKPNGKKLSLALLKIEQRAHRVMEAFCNGECNDSGFENAKNAARENVQALFNHNLQGLKINGDPRGYTLKIDDDVTRELFDAGITMQRDFGGYGLLAPEITGN